MTEPAMHRFGLAITGMNRPPDSQAGPALTGRLHRAGIEVPVIIHAAGRAAAHRGEEATPGVPLITSRPGEVHGRAPARLQAVR